MVLIFFAQLSLLTLLFAVNERKDFWINSFPKALIVQFLFVAVTTEMLSFFGSLGASSVALLWIVFLLVTGLLCIRRCIAGGHWRFPSFSWKEATLCSPLVFILGGTLITGLVFPPNTWDSMTYHMARVTHWIDNGSVAFFPTAIVRQNYQMPFSEYVIMHLQLLSGSDRFASMVQWTCFLGTLSNVFLITLEFSKNRLVGLLACLFFACTPMAILQASSTQNDVVLSFSLSATVLFLLRCRREFDTKNLGFAAVAMGLALLTKGTAYLFLAPLGLCIALGCLRPLRELRVFLSLVGVVFIALTMSLGHYARNFEVYGHPLSTEGKKYLNESVSVSAFTRNVVRNLALHFPQPNEDWNDGIDSVVYYLFGDETNESGTTWQGTKFDSIYSKHEDGAGNLLQTLLLIFAFPLILFRFFKQKDKSAFFYALGVLGAACLFCVYLKWQPWHSRLHTPLFALAGPLVALISEKLLKSKIGVGFALVFSAGVALYSFPYVYDNMIRSLIGKEWISRDRVELFFPNRPYLLKDYKKVAEILKDEDLTEVGYYAGENDWEYPLWVMLGAHGELSMRHFDVSNLSQVLEDDVWYPNLVIATKPFSDEGYKVVYESVYISVFKRNPEFEIN